jgi:putative CocE/NonD family hydrolase
LTVEHSATGNFGVESTGSEKQRQEMPGMTRREVIQALNAGWLAVGSGLMAPWTAGRAYATPMNGMGPQKYREIENTWIPMPDGTRLAARIWLPDSSAHKPVPALFNYCPYFARLLMRPEDDGRFPFFASHGYACVRVDIRGSGDSDGRPQDEYVQQEQDDGLEIIAWIARQSWCSGKVGMEGLSWSGFNSLQIAACRPPALKAIITHCSSDDRYADDAHYKGGCLLHDMFNWGNLFLAVQGQAPDPAIVGVEGWRERWLARLDAIQFNVAAWMTHQHRDAFWKHASVAEDYGRIACPVYAVGGWVDAYKNTVFKLMEHLSVPRKALVGPWTHIYPHQGVPGPAIGWLSEALRWWDHWLKDVDTGIMQEPMLRVWSQDQVASPDVPSVPGRWIAETRWPSPRTSPNILVLGDRERLGAIAQSEIRHDLEPLQTVGLSGGNWCPSGGGAASDLAIEMALDQRLDDARSLVFNSEPLTEPLEILGAPVVTLSLAVDQPVAIVAVRLNEVLPSGESGRVTYGLLNLCQRDSSEHPSALTPGTRYTVKVPLDHVAYRFQPGNCIRVAISTTYWPMVLPCPAAVKLSVWSGASSIVLPVRPPRAEDSALRPFGPAFVPPIAVTEISATPGTRVVEWDVGAKRQTLHHRVNDEVDLLQAIDTRLISDNVMVCEIQDADPTGASIEYKFTMGWERDQYKPTVIATSKLVTAPTEFILDSTLTAFNGDDKVFERVWNRRIERELL